MAMHCEVSDDSEWSEWGKCFLDAQLRTKCDSSDSCINQTRKCSSSLNKSSGNEYEISNNNNAKATVSLAKKLNIVNVPNDGEWSNWTLCNNGVMNRTKCSQWGKCVGKYVHQCTPLFGCETEEKSCVNQTRNSDTGTLSWSEWSECKDYEQERYKCTDFHLCEVELRICGMVPDRKWSDWSSCIDGSQERSSCVNEKVVNCATQERPCHNGFLGEWTEWSVCEGGSQERLICEEDTACEIDERLCNTNVGEASWSKWNECTGGTQSRYTCFTNDFGCQREEKGCEAKLEKGTEEWSEWTPCFQGYKSRELCAKGFSCEVEQTVCDDSGEMSLNEYGLLGNLLNSVPYLFDFD